MEAVREAVDRVVGPPLLHTVEEAAQRLRLSRAKVYALVMDGTIPSVKVGRSRRILATALEAFARGLAE